MKPVSSPVAAEPAQAPTSLLLDPERHPLELGEWAGTLGRVVVVAPHPDDESLGCGGLLALLAAARQPAHVVVVTDGSQSHPQSRAFPAARLAALREAETLAALAALGCLANATTFLRYGDCALPAPDTRAFHDAATRLRKTWRALAPDTLVVPWRRDPHCDHVATWRLCRAARSGLAPRPRWLEYPVWAWTHAEGEAAPRTEEAVAWRLDVAPVLARKQRAIAEHRSQLGGIIHDDPSGFVLKPSMLAHFARPWELYFEPNDV